MAVFDCFNPPFLKVVPESVVGKSCCLRARPRNRFIAYSSARPADRCGTEPTAVASGRRAAVAEAGKRMRAVTCRSSERPVKTTGNREAVDIRNHKPNHDRTMSTLVWPPVSDADLSKEIESTSARELEWLLSALQDTLASLKAGLEECATLLAPTEPGSTLVLSSLRSENLKGYITRLGGRIVKGDIQLRLPSLPPPRGQNAYRLSVSSQPTAPTIVLEQLTTTRTLINACLDVVDATRWTGDANNANFISGQLKLLHDNIQEAKAALKGGSEGQKGKTWYEDPLDSNVFDPPLPGNVSFHLSISEAALLLHVRTLEAAYPITGTNTPLSTSSGSYTGFSLRERLATALTGGRPAFHDEAHEVFSYRGQEVRVRDKVRVESQDPSLISAMAKLGALERNIALSRRSLDVVMGHDSDDF